MTTATDNLTIQFLQWVASRPRTYGDVMDAWRTSCPRLSIWEDAHGDGLIQVAPSRHKNAAVMLTPAGLRMLAKKVHPA